VRRPSRAPWHGMGGPGRTQHRDGATPPTPRGWVRRLRIRVRDRATARPDTWWWLLVLGSVAVVAGIAVLAWPAAALRTVAVLIGLWLIATGLVRLAAALADRSRPGDRQRLDAFVGVSCVVAGVACLGNTDATLAVLAAIVALQWLVGGILDIVTGLRTDRPERAWLVALGALSCLAGVMLLVWPRFSLEAFVVVTAVATVGIGVLDVVAALRLRRLATRMTAPRE
jgi:uncharacterized membrane protein HdeD (DUF308 family)